MALMYDTFGMLLFTTPSMVINVRIVVIQMPALAGTAACDIQNVLQETMTIKIDGM